MLTNRVKLQGVIADDGGGTGTLTLELPEVPPQQQHHITRISVNVDDTTTAAAVQAYRGSVRNANYITSTSTVPNEYVPPSPIPLAAGDNLTLLFVGGVIGTVGYATVEYRVVR